MPEVSRNLGIIAGVSSVPVCLKHDGTDGGTRHDETNGLGLGLGYVVRYSS